MEHDNQQPDTPKDAAPDPTEQVNGSGEAAIVPALPERLRGATPRIWIGSVIDRNHGTRHGEWMDAARNTDEIHADIQRMLAASPTAAEYRDVAEEWGIFDYEGFGAYSVAEYESIESVSRIARGSRGTRHGLRRLGRYLRERRQSTRQVR
jgi:hypothetical protein